MKKVMLCLPIIGKTKEEINESIEKAKASFLAREEISPNVTFVCDYTSVDEKEIINKKFYYASVFNAAMSLSNIIYFCEGWQTAQECTDVHTLAVIMKKDIIHDHQPDADDCPYPPGYISNALNTLSPILSNSIPRGYAI